MSKVHLSTEIAASPSRVWRALCDPMEVSRWDSTVERALIAPPDYPLEGQHVRWRCRSGLFRILHDRPQEVITEQKLSSMLRLGIVRYNETYTLKATPAGTNLALDLGVSVAVPLLGPLIHRLRARADAIAAFEASLANLKRWCEGDPPA